MKSKIDMTGVGMRYKTQYFTSEKNALLESQQRYIIVNRFAAISWVYVEFVRVHELVLLASTLDAI